MKKLTPITNEEMKAVDFETADKHVKIMYATNDFRNGLAKKENLTHEDIEEGLEVLSHDISEIMVLGKVRS